MILNKKKCRNNTESGLKNPFITETQQGKIKSCRIYNVSVWGGAGGSNRKIYTPDLIHRLLPIMASFNFLTNIYQYTYIEKIPLKTLTSEIVLFFLDCSLKNL